MQWIQLQLATADTGVAARTEKGPVPKVVAEGRNTCRSFTASQQQEVRRYARRCGRRCFRIRTGHPHAAYIAAGCSELPRVRSLQERNAGGARRNRRRTETRPLSRGDDDDRRTARRPRGRGGPSLRGAGG